MEPLDQAHTDENLSGPVIPTCEVFDRADVDQLVNHVANLPLLDGRSDEEILGFNENGTFD